MVILNVQLLKSKIVLCDKSIIDLANDVGISRVTMYRKLKEISDFTTKEIDNIAKILNLNQDEIMDIFFNHKVS